MTTPVQQTNQTQPVRLVPPWRTKFIEVANHSNFALVLTFVDENRLLERRRERTTTDGANASATADLASLATGGAGFQLSHEKVDLIVLEARECIVDKDRVLLKGTKCKVHFPRKCKELRVLGYYQQPSDKKKLVPWKNSLYSRSVRITAKVTNLKFLDDEEEVGPSGQLSLPSLHLVGIIGVGLIGVIYFAQAWL